MKQYAHFGYVYCMLMVRGVSRQVDADEDMLISGGGDGTIKLWKLCEDQDEGIREIESLGEDDARECVEFSGGWKLLYSSNWRDGWGYLWSGGSTGHARKYSTVQYGQYKNSNFSQKYQCVKRWKAHQGRILASAVTTHHGQQLYITARPDHAEDCRRGATFLRTLFKKHGAVTEMLTTEAHHNPIVYAKFKGNPETAGKRKKILFYGHYDVVGVLHATVKVNSKHPDVHSGVDGSFMMDEPLFDLTAILAKLKGLHNRIQIPGFMNDILPLTAAEEARYDDIVSTLLRRNPELGPADNLKQSIMARWREPNLTVHRYKVSGPDGSLVSSHASAAISLRLVPNQEVDDVIRSLKEFLQDAFAKLDTHNHLTITIDNQADAWLGDPENEIFRTLEEAIMEGPKYVEKEKENKPTSPISASPSLKPTPATTTSLTGGSDHTSLAATGVDLANLDLKGEVNVKCEEESGGANGKEELDDRKRLGRKPLYIREGVLSLGLDSWKKNLEHQLHIYHVGKQVIVRIWTTREFDLII
ncbi:hypothetical protein DID88_004565 [Monilinia fructigena]|uniref:Uncharacterized protein n=1 Tax=Monilinia fructigena TaxID=38457 RepID=A0A395IR15_9HELO|nr:hypothetical protein DID88_004565 [Monilinia fructigena]